MTTDATDMIAVIQRMYTAIGENDRLRLNEVLCEDFHAFEDGVHMSGQELLDLMSKSYAEGRRYRWSVASPQVEVQGDLGAVVYLNVGSVTQAPGAEPVPVSWLETVLLRRQTGRWRVAFLHSTRTKAIQSAA